LCVFSIKTKLNLGLIFLPRNPNGRAVFCLGNPDRRGVLVLQEIQVRGGGGLKNDPIRRGGVDFSGITQYHNDDQSD